MTESTAKTASSPSSTIAGASPMRVEGQARARCMCGAVQIVARFPSRFCAHCHCESCRRAHSAGFVTWVGFNAGQVDVVDGADHVASYESTPGTFRTFCRRCGTRLTFQGTKWPNETHIPLACFDDPVDRDPQGNAFVAEHAPWIVPPPTATA